MLDYAEASRSSFVAGTLKQGSVSRPPISDNQDLEGVIPQEWGLMRFYSPSQGIKTPNFWSPLVMHIPPPS